MWHRVQITPSVADRAPAIAAAMFAAGAEGVHEDADRLVTHLPAEMDPHAFVTAVRAVDDALVVPSTRRSRTSTGPSTGATGSRRISSER